MIHKLKSTLSGEISAISDVQAVQFRSVAQSCLTLWLHGLQHARLPCPSPTPRACTNSSPSSQRCHPTTSSSVIPFSCLKSFPGSGSFTTLCIRWPNYWSFSFSISPSNEYSKDWFHLGWTGWISLQSKRCSRVFSNTTLQKHEFFSVQLSL